MEFTAGCQTPAISRGNGPMPLSSTDVRHFNALTALDEGRGIGSAEGLELAAAGYLLADIEPPQLSLEGRMRLRNLMSQVRGEIERGMGDASPDAA
jgi:hypothetical protein